jgi:hypothetical protein
MAKARVRTKNLFMFVIVKDVDCANARQGGGYDFLSTQ